MTDETGRARGAGHSDVLLLGAGVADLAIGAMSTVVGGLRGLLGRSDVVELAGEGREDLKARGQLALDRYAARPPAHMEVLARHAAARRAGGADD
ncbi:polyprenyl synthetase [Streptomyces sp. NPDC004082]|uniref:polyprenyl synthetase n=2 Tax=Streptomyces TaxID=1883 RepID=UPI0036AF2AE6